METRTAYPSDLSHAEWARVRSFIPEPKAGGRPAPRYVARAGCPWRAPPHDFPPWPTAYRYSRTGKADGTLARLMDTLRGDLRRAHGRQRQPSAGDPRQPVGQDDRRGGPAATTRASRSTAASGTSWSTASA